MPTSVRKRPNGGQRSLRDIWLSLMAFLHGVSHDATLSPWTRGSAGIH
jgi:hypothetical protein